MLRPRHVDTIDGWPLGCSFVRRAWTREGLVDGVAHPTYSTPVSRPAKDPEGSSLPLSQFSSSTAVMGSTRGCADALVSTISKAHISPVDSPESTKQEPLRPRALVE